MSRKRMIHPAFWADSELGRLSRECRLLYIGIWNFADDAGLLKADAAWLRAMVFPYDDDLTVERVGELLAALVETRHLLPYSGPDERPYYVVRTFHKFQSLDHPTASKLPFPPNEVIRDLDPVTVNKMRSRHSERSPATADRVDGSSSSGRRRF